MLGKHSTTNPSGYVFILLIWHLPLYGILDTSNWTLTNGICYLHPKICVFQISFWHSNKPVAQIKILGKSSMTALVSPTLAKEHFNPNSWVYLKPGMVAHTKCLGGRLRFISEFKADLIYIGSSKSVGMHSETLSQKQQQCVHVRVHAHMHVCMCIFIIAISHCEARHHCLSGSAYSVPLPVLSLFARCTHTLFTVCL